MPVMPLSDLQTLVLAALSASGVPLGAARSVSRALIAAEVDGQGGHGLARVATYAGQARSGKVVATATPALSQPYPAVLMVDAGDGFAFPALDLAIDRLADLTPRMGLAMAGIRRSHHCGQLGAHVERLARRGLVAMMVANAPKAMAPWGGSAPLFGTNPIAFAAPRAEADPLVIDLSLSKVARGKVMAAKKAGEAIPEGWALAPDGTPTTDPEAALAGTMLPTGDAKGAALALMVEILASSLIDATPSYSAESFFTTEGPPVSVGQTLIAFTPDLSGRGGFTARIEALFTEVLAQEGARLPGQTRAARRARAQSEGIEVPEHLLTEITALAGADA